MAKVPLKSQLEALIFLSQEPISLSELAGFLNAESSEIESALKELEADYKSRGVVLKKIAGGYKFFVADSVYDVAKRFASKKPLRLSRHLLEVLAIVAYRQPVTRGQINSIRGKDSSAAIKSLLDKGLIEVVGRKKAPGNPKLYATTQKFLYLFGLKDISELPQPLKGGKVAQENGLKENPDNRLGPDSNRTGG